MQNCIFCGIVEKSQPAHIIYEDKIVVDQPSVVALDSRTDKLIAVGQKALLMRGKENDR